MKINMSEGKYPVALLLETESLAPHFHKSLQNMLDETDAYIDVILVNNEKSVQEDPTAQLDSSVSTNDIKKFFELLKDLRWSFIYKTEMKIAGALGDKYVNEWSKTWGRNSIWEIDELDKDDVITYDPIHLDNEPGVELPKELVEKISEDVEVVVCFEHNILKGDILTAPPHGVLSFHTGDLREYRGRPAGFWQFLNDESEVGVTLQQLTPKLDGGKYVEIRTIDVSDCETFAELRSRQKKLHPEMLSAGIEKLQQDSFEPKDPEEYGVLTYKSSEDELLNSLRMLKKNLSGRIRRKGPGLD